jgi:sugar O-acyltransferase (sialic acid O-acetyltransferase NeuD family)
MKIFCIGFNKTGTTSLTSFFRDNGYLVAPETPFELELDSYLSGDFKSISNKIQKEYKEYNFFQDVPFSFPELYKHLFEEFPDSKFILSVRDDEEQWHNSLISYHTKLFGNLEEPAKINYLKDNWLFSILTQVYKSPPSNPYDFSSLTQTYLKHNQDARKFFKDVPERFLEINIKEENVVEKIEKFIGVTFEHRNMPHLNQTKLNKAIFGYGGFAKEVYYSLPLNERKQTIFLVDDQYYDEKIPNLFPISKFNPNTHEVIIAVGDPKLRFEISQRLPEKTKYFTHIHPSALILGDDVSFGKGSIICAGTIITTNVKIGNHAHLNLHTTIGHDCSIGNYFTTAPGVKVSGNCIIKDFVYLGTNASVKEKISITDNVTVGLNAGVVSDIDFPGTYVGTPTKLLKK